MRDYMSEYTSYHSGRNAARRSLMKSGRVSKGDSKDVDHRNGNPRDNRKKNLSVMARSANRSKK